MKICNVWCLFIRTLASFVIIIILHQSITRSSQTRAILSSLRFDDLSHPASACAFRKSSLCLAGRRTTLRFPSRSRISFRTSTDYRLSYNQTLSPALFRPAFFVFTHHASPLSNIRHFYTL